MKTLVDLQRIASRAFARYRFIRSSYQRFDDMVGRCTSYVNDFKSIKQGHPVIMPPVKSEEWVAMLFAIMRKGAVAVPWHPGARTALPESTSISEIPKLSAFPVSDITHHRPIEEDQYALCLLTSGTSSTPKVVPLTHRNIVSNLESIREITAHLGVSPKDHYLSILPWSHCYALTCELFYGMSQGARFTISNPQTIYKDLMTVRPTLLCGVPKLYQTLYSATVHSPILRNLKTVGARRTLRYVLVGGRLRMATSGGAHLPPHLYNFMMDDLGVHFMEGYGLTEASPLISLNVNAIPGSVGEILSCNEVFIHPNTDEIGIRGSNVFSGYLGDPLPREDYFFFTGDTGRVHNNLLYLTGRKSEVYKLSNGKFVDPNVIEGYLQQHSPSIVQAFVAPSKCSSHNVAVIVLKENSVWDEEDCKQKLSDHLQHYEVPKTFHVTNDPFTVENGLLTSKHTLKRRHLHKKYHGV